MRKGILLAFWLWYASLITTMQAAAPAMRHYMIDLPHHILRFSLPENASEEVAPLQIEGRFDPHRPGVLEGGFRQIAGIAYDFKGPFGFGAYGSLKFHLIVQKKNPEFDGNIATVGGLERYVRQWNGTIEGRATGCVFSRDLLNGMSAVRRDWDRFEDPGNRVPDHLEIFSLPLNEEIFLDVGFNVMCWEGGRAKEGKWKPKAEALREAIKATIVLERKP